MTDREVTADDRRGTLTNSRRVGPVVFTSTVQLARQRSTRRATATVPPLVFSIQLVNAGSGPDSPRAVPTAKVPVTSPTSGRITKCARPGASTAGRGRIQFGADIRALNSWLSRVSRAFTDVAVSSLKSRFTANSAARGLA